MKWMYLAAGGVAGTFSRYVLSGAVQQLFGTPFPYGTLAVNTLGCLIAGVLLELGAQAQWMTPEMRVFSVTGFCGAFTTLSAMVLETEALRQGGGQTPALANKSSLKRDITVIIPPVKSSTNETVR